MVDGKLSVTYPRLTGPVEVGDEVIVNTQARGSALAPAASTCSTPNLTQGLGLDAEPEAHVMTLPYTPLQAATRHVEEDGELPNTIDGVPVVCLVAQPGRAGLRGHAPPAQAPGCVRASRRRGDSGVAFGCARELKQGGYRSR